MFTFCLFGYPGVDALSRLLCVTLEVQLFHFCFVELAAGIFKRLTQQHNYTAMNVISTNSLLPNAQKQIIKL